MGVTDRRIGQARVYRDALPPVGTSPGLSLDHGAVSKVPVETMEVLVLSTQHLTMQESEVPAKDWPSLCFESCYGWVCYVGDTVAAMSGSVVAHTPEAWPGFVASAVLAQALGYDWVRFDRDADAHPLLPVWEW
jgi:hypothetical protein